MIASLVVWFLAIMLALAIKRIPELTYFMGYQKWCMCSATHGTKNMIANRLMAVIGRLVKLEKTPPFHGGNTSSSLVPIIYLMYVSINGRRENV